MFLINFCLFCSFTLCPCDNVMPVVIMVGVDAISSPSKLVIFVYTMLKLLCILHES